MTKKKSTYEREMENPAFRKEFKKKYRELVLSELLCAAMAEDEVSVRKLAAAAKISPSVIQKIRKGQQKDMKIGNFIHIMEECGYHLVLKKDNRRIYLHT